MENALNGIGYAKQCFQTVSYKAYLPNLTYLQPKRVMAADQMIRNSSMKIGEVDSGSARLLATHKLLPSMLTKVRVWTGGFWRLFLTQLLFA